MISVRAWQVTCGVAILWAIGSQGLARAQIGVGTWVQKSGAMVGTTLTVEECCDGGRRLTYRMTGTDVVMIVESKFDGSDATVMLNGKASDQTMAINRVDDLHTVAVLKMKGQPYGTSKGTLSADGRTLTVENEMKMGGQEPGKTTEVWVKK